MYEWGDRTQREVEYSSRLYLVGLLYAMLWAMLLCTLIVYQQHHHHHHQQHKPIAQSTANREELVTTFAAATDTRFS